MPWKHSILAIACCLIGAEYLFAAPTLYHNQHTGNLTLMNDIDRSPAEDGPIIAVHIEAPNLFNVPMDNPIPGTILHTPDGFLYFGNVPRGTFNLGEVVAPRTSSSLLFFHYVERFYLGAPYVRGEIVSVVPEPSTLALGSLSLVSLAALRRRK